MTRADSSAGQSASLTPRRSLVRTLLRPRIILATACLLALVIAGLWIQFSSERTVDALAGRPAQAIPIRYDFTGIIWPAARALVRGDSSAPFYGSGPGVIYPPQYVALVAPFGLLSRDVTLAVSLVLVAVLLVAVLLVWGRSASGWTAASLALALSAPVVFALRLDHLMSVMGLAALTLAVFAHRRHAWGTVGAACAVALCRPSNAVPAIAMMVVAIGLRPRPLLRTALGAAVVLGPLTLIVYNWDPNWLADYRASIHAFTMAGPMRVGESLVGQSSAFALMGLLAIPAALAGWRNRGRPLDLDHASLVLAFTVFIANAAGLYGAIFTLPAALRLAQRPRMAASAWVFAALPWVVILVLAPVLLSNQPGPAGPIISIVSLALPLTVLPLLWPRVGTVESSPSRDSSVGRAAV